MEHPYINVRWHLSGSSRIPGLVQVSRGSTIQAVIDKLVTESALRGEVYRAFLLEDGLRQSVNLDYRLGDDSEIELTSEPSKRSKSVSTTSADHNQPTMASFLRPRQPQASSGSPNALPTAPSGAPGGLAPQGYHASAPGALAPRVPDVSRVGPQISAYLNLQLQLQSSPIPQGQVAVIEEAHPPDALFMIPLAQEWAVFERVFQIDSCAAQLVGGSIVVPFKCGENTCYAAVLDDMGPVAMALLTTKLAQELRPRNMIIFGIAGSLDNDVKVGDVVIADEVRHWTYRSAVVPEEGIEEEGGVRFTLKLGGQSFRPEHNLTTLLSSIVGAHWLNDWRANALDRLRRGIIDGAQVPMSVRDFGGDVERHVPVTKAHIASGDFVAKSRQLALFLKKHQDRNLKAIEMEAAGFLNATDVRSFEDQCPTAVIRGISDPGDETKAALDQIGHGFFRVWAAENAARFLQHKLLQHKLSSH